MDFKLTLYNLGGDTNPAELAENILLNYGENYDPGEFMASVQGDTVEVIAQDVAKGDMKMLIEDIYRDFGDEDEFMLVRLSRAENGHWFEVNPEDDD